MIKLAKIPLFLALCAFVAGCDEFGWNPLDPANQSASSANQVPAPTILLELAVPTLSETASFYDERTNPETGILTRRRTWRGAPANDVSASLLEIRNINGNSLGDPPAPHVAALNWDHLAQRQLNFLTLYASENAIGPVLWQRFTMGPKVCVVFSQGWGPEERVVTRHVVGYYCAPAATALSDGQAETVVRSIRVQEGDPQLSPDG